jgi:hypothetical protein
VSYHVVRISYWLAGVRFDMNPLESYVQYLDVQLLRERLLESLFYLHTQPPLYNLFLGVVLKLSGDHAPTVFHAVYVALGFVLYATTYFLMRELGVRGWIALVVSLVFLVNPAFTLYSSWLFYTFVVATLLALSSLFVLRFARTERAWHAGAFFASVLALCLTWSAFHLVFLVASAIGLVWLLPRLRVRTLGAAALPFLVLLVIYGKNLALFGVFGTGSWFGMNFARIATFTIPDAARERLVQEGALSSYALIRPFSDLVEYEPTLTPPVGDSILALDRIMKSTGAGHGNHNHRAFIEIARQYGDDAKAAIRSEPLHYARGVLNAFGFYVRPADRHFTLRPNREHVRGFADAYDLVVLGEVIDLLPLTVFLFLPFAVLVGAWMVLAPSAAADPAARVTAGFMVCAILYLAAIGNLFELGENDRFRFATDALVMVLGTVGVERLLRIRAARSERRPA